MDFRGLASQSSCWRPPASLSALISQLPARRLGFVDWADPQSCSRFSYQCVRGVAGGNFALRLQKPNRSTSLFFRASLAFLVINSRDISSYLQAARLRNSAKPGECGVLTMLTRALLTATDKQGNLENYPSLGG